MLIMTNLKPVGHRTMTPCEMFHNWITRTHQTKRVIPHFLFVFLSAVSCLSPITLLHKPSPPIPLTPFFFTLNLAECQCHMLGH